MATSKQRVFDALEAAGFPAVSVVLTTPPIVVYAPGVDESAAAAFLSTFDWRPEAEAAWQAARQVAAAKAVITADDAMPKATRAACFALMLSLQECRAKVNELVAAVKAGTVQDVEPLVTGDTFADALEAVAQILDAGIA